MKLRNIIYLVVLSVFSHIVIIVSVHLSVCLSSRPDLSVTISLWHDNSNSFYRTTLAQQEENHIVLSVFWYVNITVSNKFYFNIVNGRQFNLNLICGLYLYEIWSDSKHMLCARYLKSFLRKSIVIWLKYCRYGEKRYPTNK